jgi:hypothetical protein
LRFAKIRLTPILLAALLVVPMAVARRAIISTQALELGPWATADPFLFCVHHNDRYPSGDADQGLAKEHRRGRSIGSDFSGKDGFSMYVLSRCGWRCRCALVQAG